MTQAFNLSQLANKVNTSGQLDVATGTSGLLPLVNGGTGTSSPSLVAGSNISITGSFPNQTVAFVGASGLTGFSTALFTTSGTWAVPAGVNRARVTCIGGGGGSPGNNADDAGGGSGGIVVAYCTGLSGSYTITVGSGGTSGSANGTAGAGGASSFGSLVTANGGGAANTLIGGTNATGSTTQTAILINSAINTLNFARVALGGITLTQYSQYSSSVTTWTPTLNQSAGQGGSFRSGTQGYAGIGGLVLIEY